MPQVALWGKGILCKKVCEDTSDTTHAWLYRLLAAEIALAHISCGFEDNGKQLQDIVSELGYSQRTAAYGLASLTSAGLVKREGSRKTGAYTVTDIAACDTTCATCSIALQCKDYKPV